MSQQALDMPDGLRPPFYVYVYRYGARLRHEDDELADALSYCEAGEEHGEHSVDEIGDADGFLWRKKGIGEWEVSERAPRPRPFW